MKEDTLPDTQPGQVIEYDYRPCRVSDSSFFHKSLTILQWNVERNYEADCIIEKIKELDPDVCVLQEIDINCERSGNRNHMEELCRQLGMKGVFVCEFWEIYSQVRKPRDQGGGLHGNAILTKYDITDVRIIDHQYQPFLWDQDGASLNEPRKGKRYTLTVTIKQPLLPPVLVYNVHLEVFTGIIGRISAFSELFEDARIYSESTPHQVIFGDLNTMAHSIARFSPKYAKDRYRLLSLGEKESDWFDRNVLGFHSMDGSINTKLLTMSRSSWRPLWFLEQMVLSSSATVCTWGYFIGHWLTGIHVDVLKKARNPGFYDAWPLHHDTLHNPAYFGLFKAKLDWTLVRNMSITRRHFGNTDYKLSDHQYLMVQVQTDDHDDLLDANKGYTSWLLRRNQWRVDKSSSWRDLCNINSMMAVLLLSLLLLFLL